MELGEKLYRLREKSGLSQEELAEELNVSRQTISNWENDKVKIDVEKAKEICKVFNVSMDELFGNGEKPKVSSPDDTKERKPPIMKILCVSVVLLACVAAIIISAVFLAKYSPDETSSVIYLSPAAGWVIIACCALVVAGITAALLIIKFKKK